MKTKASPQTWTGSTWTHQPDSLPSTVHMWAIRKGKLGQITNKFPACKVKFGSLQDTRGTHQMGKTATPAAEAQIYMEIASRMLPQR